MSAGRTTEAVIIGLLTLSGVAAVAAWLSGGLYRDNTPLWNVAMVSDR